MTEPTRKPNDPRSPLARAHPPGAGLGDDVAPGAEPKSHELGPLDDLVDGEMRAFEQVGECGIVVCNIQGQLYAFEDKCSHSDAQLSHGRLQGWAVTCPLHKASFDVRDGTHSGPPAWTGVDCYPVTRVDGEVIVILEAL